MARCDLCVKFDDCPFRYDLDAQCSAFKQKPMTNGDRIRNMADEELAKLFWIRADCELCPNRKQHCSDDCKGAWLSWLRGEATDGQS